MTAQQNQPTASPGSATPASESDFPMIEFRKVQKAFGNLTVLDGLDLSIAPGEKLALIGPSGSGKTTILRILMTLETLSGGEVLIQGEHLWHQRKGDQLTPASEAHLHKMRKQIGMVFQHFNLFPHLSVLSNIVQPQMLARGTPRAEARDKAVELLGLVGLSDKHDHFPHQLSGGQQQRVAIARSLAMDPRIMLFDEVTSALDPELVDEVLSVLHRIAETSDTTMLMVTHEMNFARDFADRVLFFDKGRIAESGPPDQIFTHPKEARTRAFLSKFISVE